jgi:hypothetical protein
MDLIFLKVFKLLIPGVGMKQITASVSLGREELASIIGQLKEIQDKLSDLDSKLNHFIQSHELTVMAQPRTRIPAHSVTRDLSDFETDED